MTTWLPEWDFEMNFGKNLEILNKKIQFVESMNNLESKNQNFQLKSTIRSMKIGISNIISGTFCYSTSRS